jgi:hypothetical protein
MLTDDMRREGWLPWDGQKTEWGSTTGPVPGDTWVAVKFRGEPDPAKGVLRTHGYARQMAWWHDGQEDDIIAYKPENPNGQ